MQSLLMYGLFAVGLGLIIKGGDWFVDSAGGIARALGVPSFVIGATVVSLATTLPELLVSVQATAKGNVDMAAGNAIGSVTANTALILGLLLICMPCAIERRRFAPKGLLMLAAAAVLFLGCCFTPRQRLLFSGAWGEYHTLSAFGMAALLLVLLLFLTENLLSLKKEQTAGAANAAQPEKPAWGRLLLFFVLGASGILLGADLLVDYGTQIAQSLQIPQRVISIIAIAVGTSLPELVTTLSAIRKKQGALSIGNILGANIIDLTLILPLCALVSLGQGNGLLAVSVSAVQTDLLVCLAAIALAVLPTLITKKLQRWQGVLLLLGYAAYVVYVAV